MWPAASVFFFNFSTRFVCVSSSLERGERARELLSCSERTAISRVWKYSRERQVGGELQAHARGRDSDHGLLSARRELALHGVVPLERRGRSASPTREYTIEQF